MDPGAVVKRTELRRKSRLKPGKRHAHADRALAAASNGEMEMARAAMHTVKDFWDSARAQRVCAVTGLQGEFDPHHVVEKQWLRQHGLDPWDPRNALRLSTIAHARHTNAFKRVPMKCLRDENIAFAFEVMGPGAHFYLRRRYTGYDPRVELALAESEHRAPVAE